MAVKKKIAIIGAGFGGLAAAARLSSTGAEVHIFEQNDNPGGKANEFRGDGFRFDTGPSLLTMPFVIEELFSSLGKNLHDYIDVIPLSNLCKYFYPDGTIINAWSDPGKFASEIEKTTIDNSKKIKDYLKYSQKIYDLTAELFLEKSFQEWDTFFNKTAFKAFFQLHKIDSMRTMHNANESFFTDPKTVQLFDRYATYNGSNPFKAPATLNIIQHVEYNLGGFTIKGGIFKLSQALYQLNLEMGTRFHFGSKIKKIITAGNSVKGILRELRTGEEIEENFDVIVSNADVKNTYKKLLEDSTTSSAKKYNKLEPSSSALVFYLGVEGKYPQLNMHNIIFSENYKKEFKQLFEENICPDDPTVYIYISSKLNEQDAPGGNENWFVMVNAPYDSGQDWVTEIENTRKAVLDKIEKVLGINLREKIKIERMLTPPMIEEITGSAGGSLYGISSNDKTAAFMRHQNRSKDYKGLYFCGGSAHPGGGIPLVLLSGKIASDLIKKYELADD